MKLYELHERLGMYLTDRSRNDKVVVGIMSNTSNTEGTRSVEIVSAHRGFDWDNGKFFLNTEKPLFAFDENKSSKIRVLEQKLGWCEYEKRALKREITKLKSIISGVK